MRAYIVLEWKENKMLYQRKIWRTDFLAYLNNISENSEVLRELRALSKEVDSICVNADENAINKEKSLIFRYEENMDFNEENKKVDISKEENIYYFIKSYCQRVIVFKIIENNQERIRSKMKQQVISIMSVIKTGYPDKNEISTKLCEILPETFCITINKDRNNSNPENPIIICYTLTETNELVITIKNFHKIIWAHINEWCN